MKQFKLYVVIILLAILIIPSVASASWWNPFSWNIWQNIWNSIFYKQVSAECNKAKDCQDIYKNCYYSCSSNKCAKIQTFVALKPYPDCSSAISCSPNWQCGWGSCANGYQSQVPIDSNNCGLPASSSGIACTALARTCTPATRPSITVTSPNGGEKWAQGSTHNITWRATGVNNVGIFIADFQTGLNIERTIATVSASNGLYSWAIPTDNNYLPVGDRYKIMISEYGGPMEVFAVLTGASNNYFTIVAPANDPSFITVTSPNGGEIWKIGETKNITWQANRVSMVDISVKDMTGKIYSIDQGIKSLGSFSWFVGRYSGGYLFPPGQYKIEIKNTYAGAGTPPDISNNYFTVADAEFVNGVCGHVNGTKVLSEPSTGLCYSGIVSPVSGKDNLLSWLCYGTGGGVTVSCSASYGSR